MLSSFKKLRRILTQREQYKLIILFLAIILMAFTQALGVASIMPFISLVMEPNLVYENDWFNKAYNTFSFESVQKFTIVVGLVMLFIILTSNAISALATWMKIRFAWMNNHRLSSRLLRKYLSMPYYFFLNQNSADLSKNVLNEINHLTGSFLLPLLMLVSKAILVIFIMTMLIWVDIKVSLTAFFLIGVAYFFIYLSISKKLRQRGKLRFLANKKRFQVVSEAFGGIKEIKMMQREHYFYKEYLTASRDNVIHLSWNSVVGQLPKFFLEAIAFGGIIIFVLFLLVTQEEAQQVVPLASLFAFAGYRIMPALQEIFKSYTQMQFNEAVLDRIYQDISDDNTFALYQATNREFAESMVFQKEIRLQHVTYSYPNSCHPVISDINLTIHQNASVALVGTTGAGKTTLADILLGLLAPQSGNLLIDGVKVDKENLLSWQRNLGYVPQFIYLSDDTVARNIAFGLPDKKINHETVEKVARVANIHDFIVKELPGGYETMVGERGVRLSGGQRQRIGIARALYHDPEVLVFDEATSALDGATEDAVLRAMENASRFKTLIIIAHRLTIVKKCDLIYVIDKGKIVGSGTYEELMKHNLQFQAMAKVKQ